MATEGCEKLENIVTCSLCYEIFNSPKTFKCFHSFCEDCINKLKYDKTHDVNGYKCPLCRRFCAVVDIKPNFLMNELVELYRLTLDGGTIRSCTQCKSTNVEWRCLDCKIDFCAECKEGHTRVPLLRGHRLMAHKDINDTFLVDKLIFCHIHNDKPIEFNCKVCDHLLCITCKVVDHDCHKTETITTALDRIIPKIQSDINLVSSYIQEAEKRIASIKDQKQKTASNFTQMKVAMEKHKDELIRNILDDHTALLKTIDTEEGKKVQEFDSTMSTIEDRIKEQRHIITWVNTSLQAAQGASLLFEIQSGLGNKLSDMASEKVLTEVPTADDEQISFEKSKAPFGSGNILGEVIFPEVIIPQDDNVNGVQSTTTEQNHSRAWPFSIDHLAHSQSSMAQNIDILEGHLCYRFSIINNKLWLPIYNKNCILIYSYTGELDQTIRFQKLIKRPKALIAQNEIETIVSSQTGLFVIRTEDGEIQQNVCSGQFSDVWVKEHTLVALEWKTGQIQVFTQNNNKWDHVTNYGVSYSDRHIGDTFLCVTDSSTDNESYITCSWQKHTMYQCTSTGEITTQLGSPGETDPGQLYCPSLCGVDKDGTMLVADCGNHRLQISSDNTEWKVVKLEGLQCPWDVHFQDANTMWVLNNEKRLIKYSFAE